MFVKLTPDRIGRIAESAIETAALEAGLEVYRPANPHARADLIFELASGELLRVQCKSAKRKGAVLTVPLESCTSSPARGYVRRRYTAAEIDLVAVWSPELRTAYLLRADDACGKSLVSLRLAPARNGQRARLNFAADYEFDGAVAQLGERRHGMAEVRGSSPLSSTPRDDHRAPPGAAAAGIDVGAHEFRNRFGWYMERAAAGEEIRVSRRGNPCVRLLPAGPAQGVTAASSSGTVADPPLSGAAQSA
jgi:prevent-host-death family protein